ncbi:hypothetical protein KIPB_012810, partial [Kipferlia bialata]|eukprot:g12810.t1
MPPVSAPSTVRQRHAPSYAPKRKFIPLTDWTKPKGDKTVTEMDKAIAYFCAKTGVSFTIFDSEAWLDLCNYIRQLPHSYKFPLRDAVRKKCIAVAKHEEERLLQDMADSGDIVHGATDGWTDNQGEKSVKKNTTCLIYKSTSLFYTTEAVPEKTKCDGDYLCKYMKKTVDRLREHGVVIGSFATDNAGDIRRGCRLLQNESGCGHIGRAPCGPHTIQLSVTDLFDDGQYVLKAAKEGVDALGPWCKENKAEILRLQRVDSARRKAEFERQKPWQRSGKKGGKGASQWVGQRAVGFRSYSRSRWGSCNDSMKRVIRIAPFFPAGAPAFNLSAIAAASKVLSVMTKATKAVEGDGDTICDMFKVVMNMRDELLALAGNHYTWRVAPETAVMRDGKMCVLHVEEVEESDESEPTDLFEEEEFTDGVDDEDEIGGIVVRGGNPHVEETTTEDESKDPLA